METFKFEIVTDLNLLKVPCQPCKSWDEGLEVANYLIKCMQYMPHAVGLAANQVGIGRRVCVLWMDRGRQEPRVFINPQITKHSDHVFTYPEGCLSFPGEQVITKRSSQIWVDYLGPNDETVYDVYEAKNPSTSLFLAALQHEIDHLDGITMHDRRVSF